jgi:hypothetical protein
MVDIEREETGNYGPTGRGTIWVRSCLCRGRRPGYSGILQASELPACHPYIINVGYCSIMGAVFFSRMAQPLLDDYPTSLNVAPCVVIRPNLVNQGEKLHVFGDIFDAGPR